MWLGRIAKLIVENLIKISLKLFCFSTKQLLAASKCTVVVSWCENVMDQGKDIYRSKTLSVHINSREKSKFIGKFKIDQLQAGDVSRMGCMFFIHLHVLTSFQVALDSKPFGSIFHRILKIFCFVFVQYY